MPKLATKMLKLATFSSIFVAKKIVVLLQNIFFGVFTPIKNSGIKAFMKLTPGKIRSIGIWSSSFYLFGRPVWVYWARLEKFERSKQGNLYTGLPI